MRAPVATAARVCLRRSNSRVVAASARSSTCDREHTRGMRARARIYRSLTAARVQCFIYKYTHARRVAAGAPYNDHMFYAREAAQERDGQPKRV